MSLHLDMFAEISLRKIVTNIKGLELYEDIEANEARWSLENWRYISFDSSYMCMLLNLASPFRYITYVR